MWSSFRHLIARSQKAMNTKTEDRELVFAVVHAMEMVTALKANYYAAWHGERSEP